MLTQRAKAYFSI